MITQKLLHELFDYCPETGLVINRVDRNCNALAGDSVGTITDHGYLVTGINGKRYYLHRLVWCYVYGEFPADEIDHINHKRSDNRIINLRNVNRQEQLRNLSGATNNTSGCTGVNWSKFHCKWQSRISIGGKEIHLGLFMEFHEAVNARMNAEALYGFHENHGVSSEELI